MLKRLKFHVYDILVETDDGELADRIVAIFLMFLILLNAAVVAETVDDLNVRFGSIFHAIEIVSITIFTVEYFLRLRVAPLNPPYAKLFVGRLRYAFSTAANNSARLNDYQTLT